MAIPGNIRDRDHRSFVQSPTREEGQTAREVLVGNGASNPVPIYDVGEFGDKLEEFSESPSVASLGTTTIIDYTVPVGKLLKLQEVFCSGDNKAYYTIQINNVDKYKKRTWYTYYNTDFKFEDCFYQENDNIKIIVENRSSSISDFNATIKGVLTDA